MGASEIPPPDPRLYAVLAEAGFSDALFNPRQHRTCELVERYAALTTGEANAMYDIPTVNWTSAKASYQVTQYITPGKPVSLYMNCSGALRRPMPINA